MVAKSNFLSVELMQSLSESFRRFAEEECGNKSPLYRELASRAASDPTILSIVRDVKIYAPNLLFAAVRLLLRKGYLHPVSRFFPDFSDHPRTQGDFYLHFRSFCLEFKEQLKAVLSQRLLQTNEVGRCSLLLPAFGIVSRRAYYPNLSMIEVGASAGLNLLWDEYHYHYTDGQEWGPPSSAVHLSCSLVGSRRPPWPRRIAPVKTRLGIDLNPLNLSDKDDMLWLEALVWPEHRCRLRTLRVAVSHARDRIPEVLRGEASELLRDVIDRVPPKSTVCVFQCFVQGQMCQDRCSQLSSVISDLANQRDLFRVSIDWYGRPTAQLVLSSYENATERRELLAECSGHGGWLRWLWNPGNGVAADGAYGDRG